MNANRWPEIERVLDRVLDTEPSEWASVVSQACGTDEELRREVELLLAEHERSPGLLVSGPGALIADAVRAHENTVHVGLTGTRLGPWRVVDHLGDGGMSRVYVGQRDDGAFHQRVAIKVLRAGLDSPADLERFRIERQILASLDHPYIARLLDGGIAPDGRPFLVLEYVEGQPLTTYCDSNALDVPARLRLFLAVAEAIMSAHRQLVVHRDLKPSNILVGLDGRPRLLDFGIAKIVDPAGHGDGEATGTRRRWMTPHYAAPEQFTHAAVTTATDVYQLGVVLYELLTGRLPFERAGGHHADTLEIRVLRDDPPPPSTHQSILRGDLDAVILKALRKDPRARYASVADLAEDIKRVLDHEPVSARADDRAYRWRRRARRYAVPLLIGAVTLLSVIGYAATVSRQNQRIAAALAEARVERAKAEQVTRFLMGLFEVNDPRSERGDTITARTLLERGATRANALEHAPEVQAEMLDVIGRVRSAMGAFADARPSLMQSLAIRRRVLGDSHPATWQSEQSVARLDLLEGRYAEAEGGFRRVWAHQRRAFGDTASRALETLFELATTLHGGGRYKEADSLFTTWESRVTALPPRADLDHARRLRVLADFVYAGARGDSVALDRAIALYRMSIRVATELQGPDNPDLAFAWQNLAAVLWKRGSVTEADSLFRHALAVLRVSYPDGHPDLAVTLSNYSGRLLSADRHREAIAFAREASDMGRRYLGKDHVLSAVHLVSYGQTLHAAGDHAAAEPVLRRAIAELTAHYGADGVMVLRARVNLAETLGALGRMRDAEPQLLDALNVLEQRRGIGDPQSQYAVRALVRLYEAAGRTADATRARAKLVVKAQSPAAVLERPR